MNFASGIFLYFFLPGFLALYYASPRRARQLVIAVASYVFYGWWRADFMALMLVSTVVDYACGRWIGRAREEGRPTRRYVVLSACVNLGLLGFFKYANFGVDTLNGILAAAGAPEVSWVKVILPVGISFYTFQTMSYTIDVHRGAAPPARSFVDFACYVAMFPQLVAGPIVRYHDIAFQLRERTHSLARFFQGVLLLQTGLAKKVLIADMLDPVSQAAFDGTASLACPGAWTGLLAYTFQIYFDFSGYSDMAIGLGLMIGFRLPINFDGPYRSKSITEFWRRWHISLSSWLRDYLYVPLGGNRMGRVRTYVNLALTMLLGGLWHGANWTFLVWGAWHGLWLVLERLRGREPFYDALPRVLRTAFTFLVVMCGWVFFRSSDIGAAGTYFASLVGAAGGATISLSGLQVVALVTAAAVTWGFPTSQVLVSRAGRLFVIVTQVLFLLAVLRLHQQAHVPFLYYQF